MATLRIAKVAVTNLSATVRIGSLSASGSAPAPTGTVRIGSLSVTGTAASRPGATFRVASVGVSGSVTSPVSVQPIAAQTVNPYDTVQVSAFTASGTASSWTWRQISGPPVTLTRSGPTVSFVAPATMVTSTVVLGVTATSASGATSAEVQASVTTYPHTFYTLKNGAWTPSQITLIKGS